MLSDYIYPLLLSLLAISMMVNIVCMLPRAVGVIGRKVHKWLRSRGSGGTDDALVLNEMVLKAAVKMLSRNSTVELDAWHLFGIGGLASRFKDGDVRWSERAYLLYGALVYARKHQRHDVVTLVGSRFDSLYVDFDMQDGLKLRRLDEAAFGMVAVELYRITGLSKYRDISYAMFYDLVRRSQSSADGYILYRPEKHEIQYVDALGVTCPFLALFAETFNDENALALMEHQLELYAKYGVDDTGMPSHGFCTRTHIKMGSGNWGRALGWLAVALAFSGNGINANSRLTALSAKVLALCRALNIREHACTQFLFCRSSVDMSSTVMLLAFYHLHSGEVFRLPDLAKISAPHITGTGYIEQSSAGSHGVNRYPEAFGRYELTQGLYLYLASVLD